MEHSGSGSGADVEAEVIGMAIEGLESLGLSVARVETVGIEHGLTMPRQSSTAREVRVIARKSPGIDLVAQSP